MKPIAAKTTDRATLQTIARHAMTERGLEPDFSPAVYTELAGIKAPARAGAGLRNLRDWLWVSIDNDDSRDLDQLSVAVALPQGEVRILVAVADVDALVRKDMAIDRHAVSNTTSVYTSALIFPMLPEVLSTDLTSLGEDQDRLALVVDLRFAADAALLAFEIYPAQVRNHAKLAYNAVAAWLEGQGPAPARVAQLPALVENLRLQDHVAQQLAQRRKHRGSLSLETIQARAVFTGDQVASLAANQSNRATQLIEEFMIAANSATATFLAGKKFPTLRRVLRSPERWARIVQLAGGLGTKLPGLPDGLALENFLLQRAQAQPDRFPDLSLAVVKLIGRGEYVLDVPGGNPPGHFGLALKDYTHSTAPNRRFPDLLTQRLLKAALHGLPAPYSVVELGALADHCTAREDDATKIERQVQKSAAALLLSNQIGRQFDGIVTGASFKGTWVRILQPPIEGKLVRGFAGLQVGDRVHVQLVHTDVQQGFIDFARDAALAR